MTRTPMAFVIVVIFVLTLTACAPAAAPTPAQPVIVPAATTQAPLTISDSRWPKTVIPVCWENIEAGTYISETQWVRSAIERTWEAESALTFVGWDNCSDGSKGIRIQIKDEEPPDWAPRTTALGRYLDGKHNGMQLDFTFVKWPCYRSKQDCIEIIAVHEFGHALGFAHEHNRRDAFNCQEEHQGSDPAWDVTTYDLASVMNYCNPSWSGNGNLSDLDKQGVRAIYGPPNAPTIGFSKNNNGSATDLFCTIPLDIRIPIVDFTELDNPEYTGELGRPINCTNDEARSILLLRIPPGQVLRLFDNPRGAYEDDWTEIVVKRLIDEKVIGTFEESFEDDDVRVTFHRNNGLDGKVSRVELATKSLGPTIALYEGNNGSQNLLCTIIGTDFQFINFQNGGDCDNDEARSLVLHDYPAGSTIHLFDSSEGGENDDWVEIVTRRDITELSGLTIGTFETPIDNADVLVTYYKKDGLDGKVSSLRIGDAAVVMFYEGNYGQQDKVCDLYTTDHGKINFKEDDKGCENDEARSAVLHNINPGYSFTIYDSPDCKTDDDYATIRVKRPLARLVIDSFETNRDDDDVRVEYHEDNGLDGKVSCVALP